MARPLHLRLQAVNPGKLYPSALQLLRAEWVGKALKFFCWNSLVEGYLLGVREEKFLWPFIQTAAVFPAVRSFSPLLHLNSWLFPLSVWFQVDKATWKAPWALMSRHGIGSSSGNHLRGAGWGWVGWNSFSTGRACQAGSCCQQEPASVKGNVSHLVCGVLSNDAGSSCLVCIGF